MALLSADAHVAGVSSNYGGGGNNSPWGANNAIDGDPSTEWSSDGDGDDAWIEIELAQEYEISTVGFWTRTMGATAQIERFRVQTGQGEVLGPFDLQGAAGMEFFSVQARTRRLRFEVVSSSGGNTGAVEIAVYAPAEQSHLDTSDPLLIESLRRHRDDPPPTIEIVAPLVEDEHFTRYRIAYTSDGLRITGVMNVPTGNVPEQGFPVILLNHGYYSPASYTPGTGTQHEADYLAHEGYVTIASDYRGYAGSEGSFGGHFDPGWTYDILDLLDALPTTLDMVDSERVGMWGHSTGGEIALRVIAARDTVDATVLFGSMGADAADNFRLVQGWGGGHAVVQRYGTPEEAPEVWARLSPITYLADVAGLSARAQAGPISIHHGELDGEVPPELSARLWQAIQAAGVAGEYYTYPDQRHIFRGDAWEQAMERTLAFFDRYVKNQ